MDGLYKHTSYSTDGKSTEDERFVQNGVEILRKIRGESLALQGGDEADQQDSTADDGIDGVPTQSLSRPTVIVCIDGEEYPSREI